MSTPNHLPRQRVIDTKTHDTTGDQIWRFLVRGFFGMVGCFWLIIEPVTGLLVCIAIVTATVLSTRSRRRRYSDNARTLSNLNRGML